MKIIILSNGDLAASLQQAMDHYFSQPDIHSIGFHYPSHAVARQELDPDQANANVAYLRSMLTQTNTWKQARQQG